MVRKFIAHFKSVDDSDKTKAVDLLIRESTGDFDFYFFVVLSVLMATLGLIADSGAVVIGSMLLAPILFPVLSVSLSFIMSDADLIVRSIMTLIKATVLSIGVSILATLILAPFPELTSEILQRTEPSLVYAGIAVVAGMAVAYALARPDLSVTLPGIAVSVALIPPLATVGVGLASLSWSVVAGAFTLYMVNVLGIIFASMLVFSFMDLYTKRSIATKTAEEEEERQEEIAEKIEKVVNDVKK